MAVGLKHPNQPSCSLPLEAERDLHSVLSFSSLSMAFQSDCGRQFTIHLLPSSMFARKESKSFRATSLSLQIQPNFRTMWSGGSPSVNMLTISHSNCFSYSTSVAVGKGLLVSPSNSHLASSEHSRFQKVPYLISFSSFCLG